LIQPTSAGTREEWGSQGNKKGFKEVGKEGFGKKKKKGEPAKCLPKWKN